MSDLLKSVNPFIDRIPRELQEQFMTDLVTELIKLNMGEKNNSVDGGILFKYGLVFAFAKKTWKLQPFIGRCVQIWPISEARLLMIILFLIIIQIKVLTETEWICWVMEGKVCAEDYTFLWKNKLYIKNRTFNTSQYSVGS